MDFAAVPLLQIPSPPPGSIDPFLGWLVVVVLGGFTTALGILWRQSVVESKRKDELIDRLLAQVGKAARATELSVGHAERREREQRVGDR